MTRVHIYADVAELADALDSGSSEGNFMWVQVPSSAPKENGLLGIIPKSPFFIDIKKYFWFSTRIRHTACNEFAKQLSDLQAENHSLGEWFKRRLMSIMGKEKLPLLYWKCGLRTAQASKGRTFENERRK